MAIDYEIAIASPTGRILARPDTWRSLRYRVVLNNYGAAMLELPGSFDLSLVRADGRLYISRQVDGGAVQLVGEAPHFIRRWGYTKNGDSVFIEAFHATELLSRRVIPYAADTSYAAKTGPADNLMKSLVRENVSAPTDTDRDITGFAVADNTSQGPSVTIDVPRRNLLTALQDVARDAAAEGTVIYFDVTGTSTLTFGTYIGHRGRDLSATLVLSPEWGTLANGELTYDYAREVTVVYRGERFVEHEEAARSARSPYGRREATASGSRQAAGAALREGRPKVIFDGTFAPGAYEYGRDWNLGNRVGWSFMGESGTAVIEEVDGRVERGKETVTPRMRVE